MGQRGDDGLCGEQGQSLVDVGGTNWSGSPVRYMSVDADAGPAGAGAAGAPRTSLSREKRKAEPDGDVRK